MVCKLTTLNKSKELWEAVMSQPSIVDTISENEQEYSFLPESEQQSSKLPFSYEEQFFDDFVSDTQHTTQSLREIIKTTQDFRPESLTNLIDMTARHNMDIRELVDDILSSFLPNTLVRGSIFSAVSVQRQL